ncbi:nitroreductase family deazaflavin-dependent oxidoreductase [Parafrigoribacterium humi]|jgi:deazaflavin-dependent oxidoreductase (nitroreductase family)|uniref:nitroreductase family deazaflavin-dependent oxidoreductase n=1 Tax=Parafrigoribacterium humi TaxID=3144664 RepID=UPI0032EF987C
MAGDLAARILTTRWAVRAPIGLFRAGLGFLFAGKLLLLEHVGRVSGEKRYVVLETVARESRDVVIIASGFGRKAQWFRNLVAHPDCRVSIGSRRAIPMRAAVLETGESATVLDRYSALHPKAWAELHAAIIAATGESDPEIPLVRLSVVPTG